MNSKYPSNTVGIRQSMVIGPLVGAIFGAIFAIADSLAAAVYCSKSGQVISAGFAGLMPSSFESLISILWLMVPSSLAVFLPIFTILGSAYSLVFLLIRLISPTVLRVVIWIQPLFCMLALLAYAEIWNEHTDGRLLRLMGLKSAIIVILLGSAIYGILYIFYILSTHARTKKTEYILLLPLAVMWVLSVALNYFSETPDELPSTVPKSTASKPNIMLIVLDTVRADHMSCYGHSRKTTPNIDAFASSARMYTNVLSPGCWTWPSHASFFTGLPGSAHGVSWSHPYLDQSFNTLAEQLQASGYQTAGLSSNATISASHGFEQGFDILETPIKWKPRKWLAGKLLTKKTWEEEQRAFLMHRRLGQWFREEYKPDEPFFIFLNYIEAHIPYAPPSHTLKWSSKETLKKWNDIEQYEILMSHMLTGMDFLSPEDIADLKSLYDDEIAYVDSKVGELIEFLERNQFVNNTLIIITADHGEHFNEHHMFDHEFSVYEPLVRVPLIVKYADQFEPGEDHCLVQSHDIYPTILELTGINWNRTQAHNCKSLLDPHEPQSRIAVTEYLAPEINSISRVSANYPKINVSKFLQHLRAIRTEEYKLIMPSNVKPELYDLSRDPLESNNLASQKNERVEKLTDKLEEWLNSFQHYEPSPIDSDQLERLPQKELEALINLGYVK